MTLSFYTSGPQKQSDTHSELRKTGVLTKKQAHLAMNILLQLHHKSPCLVFILDTHLGRQARNHPCVPRQALARGTPDGVELLDWGWRRSAPGKRVAELAAYRCTELEHVQFWRATELGFRPHSPPCCTVC